MLSKLSKFGVLGFICNGLRFGALVLLNPLFYPGFRLLGFTETTVEARKLEHGFRGIRARIP